MPLVDAQKMQVRRHLKYPVIGLMNQSPAGASLGNAAAGYRYFQAYGLLEWRMNNLQPSEEAALFGLAVGGVAVVGPQPNVGDTVSVTISGGGLLAPQVLTTPPFAAVGQDGRLVFCQQIAAALSQNSALVGANFVGYTPYGTGPFAAIAVPVPEVGFQSPLPFAISCSGTGAIAPQVTSQGALVPPSTSLDGGATTIFGYIGVLNGLEFAHGSASDNLDTAKADVWTARSNELALRSSLYEQWVAMLSNFMGIPVNPDRKRANDAHRLGALRYA
jgi:hypothetical protein